MIAAKDTDEKPKRTERTQDDVKKDDAPSFDESCDDLELVLNDYEFQVGHKPALLERARQSLKRIRFTRGAE